MALAPVTATAQQPYGREITFDYVACSAYFAGAAAYYKRNGDHQTSSYLRDIAENFTAFIVAHKSFSGGSNTASTLATSMFLRREMEEAVNSKEWLDRYNEMFWPLCSKLQKVAAPDSKEMKKP